MIGHFCRSVWRKRRSSRFNVAEVTIKSRQRCTRADDSQINSDTVRGAKKILRSVHQFAAQSGSLAPWFHAEQTQAAAIAANFDIDAASEAHRIFRQQKFSLFHVLPNTPSIDAVALDEGQLDAERHVDQSHEGFDLRALCETNPCVVPIRKRICGRAHRIVPNSREPFRLKRADAPNSSSMRRSWLYLAMRSVRLAEPVLIWPAAVATARSAMKVSSVSPERWEMMEL